MHLSIPDCRLRGPFGVMATPCGSDFSRDIRTPAMKLLNKSFVVIGPEKFDIAIYLANIH